MIEITKYLVNFSIHKNNSNTKFGIWKGHKLLTKENTQHGPSSHHTFIDMI